MAGLCRELSAIIEALRGVIKTKGIKYAEIATAIGVSEKTVKRLMTGQCDVSVARLTTICDATGIDLFDLMKRAKEPELATFTVSEDQERFLVEHPHHACYFSNLVRGGTPEELAKEFNLTLASTRRYLKDLEEQGLVERLPYDQCRSKFSGSWIGMSHGPWARSHMAKSVERMRAFLSTQLPEGAIGALVTASTRMSHATALLCHQELCDMITRFHRRAKYDSLLPKEELIAAEWALGIAAPMKAFPDWEIINLEKPSGPALQKMA